MTLQLNKYVRQFTFVLFVILLVSCWGKSDKTEQTSEVQLGSLEVTVSAKGILKPVKEEAVTAKTWGVISFMWEHGQPVNAGEVVLRIDDSDLRDRVEMSRYDVEIRKAGLVKTEKDESERVRAAELTVKHSETNLKSMQIALEEIKSLPKPDDLNNVQNALESAKRIYELRKNELDIVRKLHDKGAVASSEVQGTESNCERARIEVEKAQTNLSKVKKGPSKEEIRQAELNVTMAELNLERDKKQFQAIKTSSDTNIENARQYVKQGGMDVSRQQDRLKYFTESAPKSGVVLYAPGRWGMPWQPGSDAGRGFVILTIPAFDYMKAEVNIPESDISDVRVGQPVKVHVTSIPNETFTGKVSKTVDLAKDEFEDLDNYTKDKLGRAERRVFTVEITLDQSDPRLKPGLNVITDIIVEQRVEALLIPLAAIGISSQGGAFIEVAEQGGFRKEKAQILANDEAFAQVEAAVKPGDKVRLITEEERLFHVGGAAFPETDNE